jgi:uncharacterized protein (UPF0303 family)
MIILMEYTPESLLAEEVSLRLPSFSNDAAFRLGLSLARRARSEGLSIAVAVVRGGQRLFWFSAEGTSADNDSWLERKVRTVLRFGHSSLYMTRKLASANMTMEERYGISPADYAFSGGGFPIALRGTGPIGCVAVSGLAHEEDHRLVVEALAALKK